MIFTTAKTLAFLLVTHAHGTRRWQIHLTRTGKIDSMWFQS